MSGREPLAAIFGCAGVALTDDERAFFRDSDPLGFILFQRNCERPEQVRTLVGTLRETIRRGDAPVLIDQEGGRVARLKPPHWPAYPAPAAIAALGGETAVEAARLGARLIADDLAALGITIDCVPVLDIPVPGADPVIGDRAWGDSIVEVTTRGRAVCEGMLEGGVLPVIKHIPGHGRAMVDSHRDLPRVEASRATLEASDFAPFRALRDMPWAMTAHIAYAEIDNGRPATLSPKVVAEVIRTGIGFDGVLLSDDLSMRALAGTFAERTAGALAAGCDVVLHCSGDIKEMTEIAGAAASLTTAACMRLDRGEALRRDAMAPIERETLEARFRALLARAA